MSTYEQTGAEARDRAEATYDAGLRRHMLQVYNYMASGILLTGIVALTSSAVGLTDALYGKGGATLLGIIVMLAPLAYVFVLNRALSKGTLKQGQIAFWSLTAIMGVSTSVVFLQYTGTSIAGTFFATAAAFAGLSLYGYTTKRDLTPMASFLVMAVWGIVAVMVVNLFIRSPAMSYAISAVGVLVFSGLTAADTQRARAEYSSSASAQSNERSAIWNAFNLYLDFINLMLSLLRLFGVKVKD